MADDKKTILVVDDEPDARDFFTTVLEDHGFDVLNASNGTEAIESMEEFIPDLVTLDITMPEKSGVAVYRKLREDERFLDVPVIIITGVSDDFKQFISTRRQVPPPDGYISKPVEAHDLVAKVEELLS